MKPVGSQAKYLGGIGLYLLNVTCQKLWELLNLLGDASKNNQLLSSLGLFFVMWLIH